MRLVGARCEKILRQEYWYKGELVESVNALHFKVAGGPWYRVFFDGGVFFDRGETDPRECAWAASDCRYPLVDLSRERALAGKLVLVRARMTRLSSQGSSRRSSKV